MNPNDALAETHKLLQRLRGEKAWLIEQLAAAWKISEHDVDEMLERDFGSDDAPTMGMGKSDQEGA